LLAPEEGSETRKNIIGRLKIAKDELPESARPIMDSLTTHVEQFRHATIPDAAEGLKDEAARLLEVFNTASKTKLMSVSGIGDATRDGSLTDVPMTPQRRSWRTAFYRKMSCVI
jgi:Cu/Ag efflux pump CusA